MMLIRHPHQRVFPELMLVPRLEPRVEITIRPDLVRPLRVVEREAIESAMILCGGDTALASERLEIGRATLYRKLSQWRSEDFEVQGEKRK